MLCSGQRETGDLSLRTVMMRGSSELLVRSLPRSRHSLRMSDSNIRFTPLLPPARIQPDHECSFLVESAGIWC
jgi:hypothetical protein